MARIDRDAFELSRLHSRLQERGIEADPDVLKALQLVRLGAAVLRAREETSLDEAARKQNAAMLEETTPGEGAAYLKREQARMASNIAATGRAWRAIVHWTRGTDADALFQLAAIAKNVLETWKGDGDELSPRERADLFLRILKVRRRHNELARLTRHPTRAEVEAAFDAFTTKKKAARGRVKWLGLIVLLARACGIRSTNDAVQSALRQREFDTR